MDITNGTLNLKDSQELLAAEKCIEINMQSLSLTFFNEDKSSDGVFVSLPTDTPLVESHQYGAHLSDSPAKDSSPKLAATPPSGIKGKINQIFQRPLLSLFTQNGSSSPSNSSQSSVSSTALHYPGNHSTDNFHTERKNAKDEGRIISLTSQQRRKLVEDDEEFQLQLALALSLSEQESSSISFDLKDPIDKSKEDTANSASILDANYKEALLIDFNSGISEASLSKDEE